MEQAEKKKQKRFWTVEKYLYMQNTELKRNFTCYVRECPFCKRLSATIQKSMSWNDYYCKCGAQMRNTTARIKYEEVKE